MNVLKYRDEVYVPRKRREKFTKLEERKMWFFFARELRAGNECALKRRRILWKMYAEQENTKRKMLNLYWHFNKYMIKYVHKSDMAKEDIFLCLRFFNIGLNPQQQRWLGERYGCDVECTLNGSFRKANFSFGQCQFTLPTEEEMATIIDDLQDEIDEEDDIELQEFHNPENEQQNILGNGNPQIRQKANVQINNENNQNNDHQNLNDLNIIEIHNIDKEMVNIEIHALEDPIAANHIDVDEPQIIDAIRSENSSAIQIRNEVLQMNIDDGHSSRHSPSVQIEIENSSLSSMRSTNQKLHQNSPKVDAKKAFMNGALKVFDGKMNTCTFIDPFLYIHDGIYAENACGINWLVGKDDDEELANTNE